jgi:hypothetical protein
METLGAVRWGRRILPGGPSQMRERCAMRVDVGQRSDWFETGGRWK